MRWLQRARAHSCAHSCPHCCAHCCAHSCTHSRWLQRALKRTPLKPTSYYIPLKPTLHRWLQRALKRAFPDSPDDVSGDVRDGEWGVGSAVSSFPPVLGASSITTTAAAAAAASANAASANVNPNIGINSQTCIGINSRT